VRVAIVDTYYPAFLDRFYAERPELKDAPYDDQHAELMARCFGTFDAYSRGLRALSHEAVELVANCAPLQTAWAREHGGRSRGLLNRIRDRKLTDVLARQLSELDPDVVYVQALTQVPLPLLARLRAEGRLVAGQIASPAPSEAVLRAYDLIVSSFPHFVERFRAMGIDSEYLPLAFDPVVLERLPEALPPSQRPVDVAFVGGVDPSLHATGTALLERVASEVGLEVWGYGADRLPASSPLRARHHGEAWGLDMFATLARARVVVNRHIDVAEDFANNMRLFEATGTGALLVTDAKRNLGDLFEPGEEVVAYDGADDLVARVRALLEEPATCDRIAAAGQARTLRDHTYGRRMEALAELLAARLPRYSHSP
jgi:spore maturation protein CgeB